MDPDAIVQAVQQLNRTIELGQNAQENYFKGLEQKIGDLANALGKEKTIGEDNRRGSNAYAKAREFLQLPEDKRRQARWQYKYGVLNEEGRPATGRYNLRRNVGLLNLPEAHQLLEEGHFQQAAYQVASGLLRSPYSRPFTYPTGARLGAQGLDIARNRVIGQRLGQPNMMGMTTGAMGPGAEDFSSGLGSYIASLTAFPSMFASKTGEPFSMFGGSMAPAVSQGYQMRKEAFMRSLNPFSMMGYQQNLNIIEATSSKGFRSMGERFQVSDIVRDLVQKVGVDAGAAIDTLDLAIKRLGMDAEDAQEQMELFGTMSRGAGKGVAQFAKETLDVLNQMSLQNTRGPGALRASSLISSIPQVSGQGVFNLLTSPTLTGLTMGTMAGQGAGIGTLSAMAMGAPFAAGGGREALEMTGQSLSTYRKYVDMMMQSLPEDQKQNAFVMAAQVFGLDGPMTAERIYNETPKIQKQVETLGALSKFQEYEQAGVYGKGSALSKSLGKGGGGLSKEAGAAYKNLRSSFKTQREQWKGGRGKAPVGMGVNAAPGVNFKDPTGQNDQQFNIYVQRMIAAKRFKTESVDEVYEAAVAAGLDPEEITRAADLYIAAGRGDDESGRAAFAKLASEYDVIMQTEKTDIFSGKGSFYSKELKSISEKTWAKMGGKEKGKYKRLGKETLDIALKNKQISPEYYKEQLAKVESGKFDFTAFEEKIAKKTAQQSLAEGRQMLGLTDEAKKLVKLLPEREASTRGGG